jgi:CRP-like cAMP-binding protein
MRFELLPPVPAVSMAQKLRKIPLFRFASVDELFRISGISQQARYAPNAKVQDKGAQAEHIQILLEGRFRSSDGVQGEKVLAPPAMLGIQEVLHGGSLRETATAEVESVALVMAAEEFRTLLAANIELAQGLFRMLLQPGGAPGEVPSVSRASSFRFEPRDEPLRTVEKAMYLQTIPILSGATGSEIFEVSAIAREIPIDPGKNLFEAGSPPAIVLVLSGQLAASNGNKDLVVDPGDCLGIDETLAGSVFPVPVRAVSAGKMLQLDRESLFDLLADRMDLLQGLFGAVFSERQGRTDAETAVR